MQISIDTFPDTCRQYDVHRILRCSRSHLFHRCKASQASQVTEITMREVVIVSGPEPPSESFSVHSPIYPPSSSAPSLCGPPSNVRPSTPRTSPNASWDAFFPLDSARIQRARPHFAAVSLTLSPLSPSTWSAAPGSRRLPSPLKPSLSATPRSPSPAAWNPCRTHPTCSPMPAKVFAWATRSDRLHGQ